jgi:isopenicillin N synthase-like dioxygenase
MEDYFRAAFDLSLRLMQSLALSLDLPEDHFADFCADAVGLLRLLHYPQQPADPPNGQKGAGAHSDIGAITLLLQDDAGGLQIWDERQGWVHAPPRPGAYIVNLADLIARFTNDRYRSTRHRVINVSGRDRYSIPFFLDGNPDYLVSCLPSCLEPGERPHYPPVTVADYTRPAHRRRPTAAAP